MKVSVGLHFQDREYEEALSRALRDEFIIYAGSFDKGDILLTDGTTGRENAVILDRDMRCEGVHKIRQRIIDRYCNIYDDYSGFIHFADCLITCVCSPSGGTGCSAIAYALACAYSAENLGTLYISFDDLPDRPGQADRGLSNINEAVYLMDEGRDITGRIPSFTRRDDRGVTRLIYLSPYNYLNLAEEGLTERFIGTVAGAYERMVIDLGAKADPRTEKIRDMAGKLVMVTSGNDGKEKRYRELLERAPDLTVVNMAEEGEGFLIPVLGAADMSFEGALGIKAGEIKEILDGCEGSTSDNIGDKRKTGRYKGGAGR